jgi:hypothetical protein
MHVAVFVGATQENKMRLKLTIKEGPTVVATVMGRRDYEVPSAILFPSDMPQTASEQMRRDKHLAMSLNVVQFEQKFEELTGLRCHVEEVHEGQDGPF